ncbi:hypothetical protein J2Z49_000727 [Desulfofundulus luciae]|uniref:Uncharacterized protein n=1 Tax=Desulfofundulus luciae TaxID=74702 RepID=A0ABU0B2E0_9FIRM|nr:hypothetical protein [Desulfofundulus luciae]MDQ0285623.1 hypothetical protein [Desulfofundulus luciae]
MSKGECHLKNVRELKQHIRDLLDACTTAWQYLILGEEKKAMGLMATIIDLLERIVSAKSSNPVLRLCCDSITFLLPRLLKATEERNGILLADILEHELKPILADTLEHASDYLYGG